MASSECFRPIQNDELLHLPESLNTPLSVSHNQQHEHFLASQQKRQKSGSESATVPAQNLLSSHPPIAIENLLQQQGHQLQRSMEFSIQQQIGVETQQTNNDERYQQNLILGLFYHLIIILICY